MLYIILAFLLGLIIGGKLGFELFRYIMKDLGIFKGEIK